MFSEIVTMSGAALTIIEKRRTILQSLRRFRRLILRGRWRVPVFGSPGTGKTVLGRFLSGQLDTDLAVQGYRETLVQEEFSLQGEIPCILLVAIGQKFRRPKTWPTLFRLVSAGKAGGVINVVSWGYHSADLEYARYDEYREGISSSDFLTSFLEHNRQDELDALRLLAPHLKSAEGRIWMVTLVTKQDLWWSSRHEVEDHYARGEYDEIIKEIAAVKGTANFVHRYCSVSLIPQNLTTTDGVLLENTAAGYDQPTRIENLERFVRGLSELMR